MTEMITNLSIEKAGEMVLDTAINKISEYKEKKKWETLFVDTNEFLLKKVERGDELLNKISEYLSSEEIKQIALNLTQDSKYELLEKLHVELKKLMMQYEIPVNEAEYYISGFVSIILHELEKVNPAYYQCAYLGDWRQKEEKALEEMRNELHTISNAISSINKNEVLVYTPEQIELNLYSNTINPSLNLDFFEIDDEVFRDEFEDSLVEDNIYVKGQCKEETIYCILNELRRIHPDKLALVVKSEDDWRKLRKANEQNEEIGSKILIPWFYGEQIISIPNNTNIFVFGSEEHTAGKHVLELRKRKRVTIRKKLEKLGMDYESAYRLVDDTHGLYIPMKKKLINGIDTISPKWLKIDRKLLVPLLLCGKWTETDGDIMVLEDLCGISYQEIQNNIRECINCENPLFVRFKDHGRTIIHLASTENAWGYLDNDVDVESELWKKYVGIISYIVLEEDPMYNFPKKQQHYANLLPGGSPCWSMTLKEGLLRSLVMKAYLNNNPQNQRIIDGVVSGLLDNVTNKKQWLSIAKLFPTLCEASPSAVEKRLDEEWEKETGLIDVFLESKDSDFFAKNEYTHYIWGIEQFLCQKDYAAWAIRWLFRMNELRREYPISNSPYATLSAVFCSWFNITVLTQDEKTQLAKEAFSNKYNVWDLFYLELPGMKNSIMSSISKPKYRMVDEPIELTNGDVWNAFSSYTDLCLNNMEFMASRWVKVIERINHFNAETIIKIADRLRYEILSMDDAERILIKEKIREEIYRNRYFNSSDWAMKESEIKILEGMLQDISVDNQIYEYRYLFKNQYNFPLMNPYPYSENERLELNEKLMEEEIRQKIQLFKERGLDIIQLAEICSEFDYSTLGMHMFTMYSEKKFDVVLFKRMIVNEKIRNIMLDYTQTAYRHSQDNLQTAYRIAKEYKVSNETKMLMLKIEILDIDKCPLIMDESEDVKKLYWNSFGRTCFVQNDKTAHLVIDEMLKYSNHMCIIEILDNCKEYFSEEEILEILEKIRNYEVGNVTQMTQYHIENLLSKLQDSFTGFDEIVRVAILELSYRGIINVTHMKCLNRCLRESPLLYLQMLAVIFKTDDGYCVDGVELDESNISSIYSLYHDLKFCPAEENGKIDAEKLENWIYDLEKGLKNNKQSRLIDMILGKLFAFSPKGRDGFYPAEEVRAVIENRYTKSLENEYVTTVYNSRGVYSPTGGEEERSIAMKYKENADKIRLLSPNTAKIYDHLYEQYMYEADSERESDEYAGV